MQRNLQSILHGTIHFARPTVCNNIIICSRVSIAFASSSLNILENVVNLYSIEIGGLIFYNFRYAIGFTTSPGFGVMWPSVPIVPPVSLFWFFSTIATIRFIIITSRC